MRAVAQHLRRVDCRDVMNAIVLLCSKMYEHLLAAPAAAVRSPVSTGFGGRTAAPQTAQARCTRRSQIGFGSLVEGKRFQTSQPPPPPS